MATLVRLLVVLLLANFATGSYAQTTSATTMAFEMPAAAMDMQPPALCDHCKSGIAPHAGFCDAACLSAIILPSALEANARVAAASPIEVRHIWGYEGEPISPIPPPPKTTILG